MTDNRPSMRQTKAKAHRRRTYDRGRWAERLATLWLELKGYRILAARFRTPWGEADLIAKRGNVLAVVEVKRRDTLADALEAVGPHAQARIAAAARGFLTRRPELADLTMRYDVMAILPRSLPRHIRGAWEG